MLKQYKLIKNYKENKKGTLFYLIAESEFIGVKEYVLRTQELTERLSLTEAELEGNFVFIGYK